MKIKIIMIIIIIIIKFTVVHASPPPRPPRRLSLRRSFRKTVYPLVFILDPRLYFAKFDKKDIRIIHPS